MKTRLTGRRLIIVERGLGREIAERVINVINGAFGRGS